MARSKRKRVVLVRGEVPPDIRPIPYPGSGVVGGESSNECDTWLETMTWEELALIRGQEENAAMKCRVLLGLTYEVASGRVEAIRKESRKSSRTIFDGALSDEVKALAQDPSREIAAIKLLCEQTGLGLKEAKDAVEAYMGGRN